MHRVSEPSIPLVAANALVASTIEPSSATEEVRRSRAGAGGRWLGAVLVVWGAIALWRAEVVALPPYEDQAQGLWAEADYLVASGFDYYSLRFEEEHFFENNRGSRSYMISLLPTLLAMAMAVAPTTQAVIVGFHLVSFALAASILLLVVSVLSRVAPVWAAALVAVAIVTTPLVGVQVDMVGMELPLTLATLLAARAVFREQFVRAAAWSLVAFFMKATGLLVTLALGTYLLLAWFSCWWLGDESGRRRSRRGLVATAAVVLLQVAVIAVGDPVLLKRTGAALRPEALSPRNAWFTSPDVVVLLAVTATVAALAAGVAVWRNLRMEAATDRGRARRARPVASGLLSAIASVVRHAPGPVFVAIALAAAVWAVGNVLFMPRYLTWAVPLAYLLSGWLVLAVPRLRRMAAVLLVAVIGFNVLNAEGRFYPRLEVVLAEPFAVAARFHPRACVYSERSREYLADLRSTIDAMRRIEASASDQVIMAGSPYSYYLTRPRLGYVTRPLEVVEINYLGTALAGFRDAMLGALAEGRRDGPLVVYIGFARVTVPPPEDTDEIVYADALIPPLVVYRKRWTAAHPSAPREIEDWYLAQLGPEGWPAERLLAREFVLAETGRLAQAIEETRAALAARPQDATIAELLDELLLKKERDERGVVGPDRLASHYPRLVRLDRDLAEGLQRLERGSDQPPIETPPWAEVSERFDTVTSGATHYARGLAALAVDDFDLASERFAAALDDGLPMEQRALAALALATIRLHQGRLDEAARWADAARQWPGELPEAQQLAGRVHLAHGDWQVAADLFERAIEMAPQYVDAHVNRGLALARLARWDEARRHWEEARAIDPDDLVVRYNLSRLAAQPPANRP